MHRRNVKKEEKKANIQKELISAASSGHLESVKLWLEAGADINADATGEYHTTNNALGIAIKNGNRELLIYLLDQCSFNEIIYAALAVEYKHNDIARLLLSHGSRFIEDIYRERINDYRWESTLEYLNNHYRADCIRELANIFNSLNIDAFFPTTDTVIEHTEDQKKSFKR